MSFPLERSLLCLERLAIWEKRADLSLTATLAGGRGVCVCVCVCEREREREREREKERERERKSTYYIVSHRNVDLPTCTLFSSFALSCLLE